MKAGNRKAGKKNMGNKNEQTQKPENRSIMLLALITTTSLLVCSYIGFRIWKNYEKNLVNNQKEQMLLTVKSLADNLSLMIHDYEADLNSLYATAKRAYQDSGKLDWGILNEYAKYHGGFVYDVTLENPEGNMVESTYGYRITQISSVTEIDQDFNLIQCCLENGKWYLALQKNLADGSCLSIFIDEKEYYDSILSDIRLGTNGYVIIKDSGGTILMHPDESQWGIDVIEGRSEIYPDKDLKSLSEMVEKQKMGEVGVSEYYSYWWMKPEAPRVQKISAYAPAVVGNQFLIVSTVIDYDDFYLPVSEGFFKLLLVFACIVLVILVMIIILARLLRQKKRDTEQIVYLLELNRILGEMHQSEELIAHQQRLQIMGTMTGGVAHEFNNLLTPIMGYADLLMLELSKGSDSYENAWEIYETAAKAKEMIQQISSLSRKNMETAYKNLNAAKVFCRALKMVQSVCPPNVRLEVDVPFSEVWFLGNETQMNQVILNICINAIHAIGHGDGTVTIGGQVVETEELTKIYPLPVSYGWEYYLKLDIADDGCGMGREMLRQIFDPFFTTKKGEKGTGLGLSLVEQIITSHKGVVFAESEPGKGSVFHICLPINQQAREQTEDTEKLSGNMKLLIVDDNPKVLKLLERNFSRLDIPIYYSMDFAEARRLLMEITFDAIVAESWISGMSAVDFSMAIQGQFPEMIRIVMADQVTKEILEAKQRGIIHRYIGKPVSDTSILKAVRDAAAEL